MIDRLKILRSNGTDPFMNIALEKTLTDSAAPGELVLFLWQNRHTVVIGRNQNALLECDTARLSREGGFLARRLSGGGAVYHDLGNLNFSFCVRGEDYDVGRQTEVILAAVRALGVPAEKTGRNDLAAESRKFSGHAYYKTHGCCCHHGTLMIDVDTEALSRYLTVSQDKLQSKGVRSVRSRVVNLAAYCPGLSAERLSEVMAAAFEAEYGLTASEAGAEEYLTEETKQEAAFLASDEWLYGRRIPFSVSFGGRFSWGGIEFRLAVNEGIVRDAEVFSDAMDAEMAGQIREAVIGIPFRAEDLAEAIHKTVRDADETVLCDLEALCKREVVT